MTWIHRWFTGNGPGGELTAVSATAISAPLAATAKATEQTITLTSDTPGATATAIIGAAVANAVANESEASQG